MGEIIQWNINGLKSAISQNFKNKVESISSVLEKNSTLIFNIQETHFLNESDAPLFTKVYEHLFHFINAFATNGDPFSGILICISKKYEIERSDLLEAGRLLCLEIRNKASNKKFTIFSTYLKSGNANMQITTINKMKQKLLNEPNLNENCIILGDFNFVTNILDRNSMALNNIDRQSTETWQNFEDRFEFQDAFRLTNPKRRIYSFFSRRCRKICSRIDRMYISSNLCGKIMSSSYVSSDLSDHKIYKTIISPEVDIGRGLWVFNNQLLNDQLFVEEVNEIIQNHETENEFEDSRVSWDILKQKIMNFSQNFSKEKAIQVNKEYYNAKRRLVQLETLPAYLIDQNLQIEMKILKQKINNFEKTRQTGAML